MLYNIFFVILYSTWHLPISPVHMWSVIRGWFLTVCLQYLA